MSADQLNTFLERNSYIGSDVGVTKEDYKIFASMKSVDEGAHPHLARWHSHVSRLIYTRPHFDFAGNPIQAGTNRVASAIAPAPKAPAAAKEKAKDVLAAQAPAAAKKKAKDVPAVAKNKDMIAAPAPVFKEGMVLEAGKPPPLPADGTGLTCLSYNVLFPNHNNNDSAWYVYKYYRDTAEAHTCWPARQKLLQSQILSAAADIVCLQEVSGGSFDKDFAFMVEAGYVPLLHAKGGQITPATFWKKDRWELIVAQHKNRTVITALRKLCGSDAGTVLFVINGHLSAWAKDTVDKDGKTVISGPGNQRLSQVHGALEVVAKEAKKMGLDASNVPVLVCGDFNSEGNTAVRELLIKGAVGPDFREADSTKQITSKELATFANFADAAEVAFGLGKSPATLLCENIDSKMKNVDGSLTQALKDIVNAAFDSCCSEGRTEMHAADVDCFLLRVNRELGRGSEFEHCQEAFKKNGQPILKREDFMKLYDDALLEGKFWAVEHDMNALLSRGLAVREGGPCQLRFDYIYFQHSLLQLQGVWDPMEASQKAKIFGEPWDILPNPWWPSDHLPVQASFTFI